MLEDYVGKRKRQLQFELRMKVKWLKNTYKKNIFHCFHALLKKEQSNQFNYLFNLNTIEIVLYYISFRLLI